MRKGRGAQRRDDLLLGSEHSPAATPTEHHHLHAPAGMIITRPLHTISHTHTHTHTSDVTRDPRYTTRELNKRLILLQVLTATSGALQCEGQEEDKDADTTD